jgi:hypothetical protein
MTKTGTSLLGLIVALTVASSPPGAAAQDGPMERLESLGRALRQQPQWRASYHQNYVPAGMTQGEEVDGIVWVAWPDRALFRAGEPWIRSMGLDGRKLRLVDRELSSCDDHLVSDDEWARIPLAAVLEPQRAVDHFTVLSSSENGFALEPRQPGGVARVEVGLGPENMPAFVVVVDPQGATNRLDFSGWTVAPSAPDGGWLPDPPAGVPCISDTE